jgi:hypothetical protein
MLPFGLTMITINVEFLVTVHLLVNKKAQILPLRLRYLIKYTFYNLGGLRDNDSIERRNMYLVL